MSAITQIGLLDNCIDGDRERLNALLGGMHDHFYCLYNILKQIETDHDIPVVFSKDGTAALFECPVLPIVTQPEITGIDCKISIRSSKKKTSIRIDKKQRRGGDIAIC